MQDCERETIIRLVDDEKFANVYSCHQKIWTKMEKFGLEPIEVFESQKGRIIAKEYELPKRCISLRNPAKRLISEEERQKRAENLKKARMASKRYHTIEKKD